MNIKHIVLSGGGPIVFVQYGVLKQLIKNNIIIYKNIESIYCVSAGCLCAVLLILNIDFDIIDNYLINRPWEKILNIINNYDYINLFYSKGLYDIDIIKKILNPLLIVKNISPDITLKQFYEHFKIDIHIFSTNITTISKVDFNYIDYPDYKLVDCIYMSCCAPIMFKPKFINDNCYIDGCVLSNAPYYNCINQKKCKTDEIIILKCYSNNNTNYIKILKHIIDTDNSIEDINIVNYINDRYTDMIDNDSSLNEYYTNVNENTNIIMYFLYTIKKLVSKILSLDNILYESQFNVDPLIENQFINCSYICRSNINIFEWIKTFSNKIERQALIIYGQHISNLYLNKYNLNDTLSNDISYNDALCNS